jgi:hypothetical protein
MNKRRRWKARRRRAVARLGRQMRFKEPTHDDLIWAMATAAEYLFKHSTSVEARVKVTPDMYL